MAKFRECPECGSALDFGEQCDCTKKEDVSVAAETSSNKGDAFVADITAMSGRRVRNE